MKKIKTIQFNYQQISRSYFNCYTISRHQVMSTSSSPFPENRSNASVVLSETSSNKQYIAKLEFQLQSAQMEKRILQEEKEQINDNYTKLIKEKNLQIENLKLNFKFVYDEKLN